MIIFLSWFKRTASFYISTAVKEYVYICAFTYREFICTFVGSVRIYRNHFFLSVEMSKSKFLECIGGHRKGFLRG